MMLVDSAVVIRWFTEQPGHEAAKSWLAEFTRDRELLVAPDVLTFEVFGGLCRLQPRRHEDWSIRSFRLFLSLGMRSLPTGAELYSRAAELSRTLKIGGYDAVYLAHAEALGIPWLTADTKVLRRLAGDARVRGL